MERTTTFTIISPHRILCGLLLCVAIAKTDAKVTNIGACFQEATGSYRCAMNGGYCREEFGEAWIKPHELKRIDGRKLCSCGDTHIGNCSPSHGYRGNCGLEELICPADNSYFNSKIYFFNDGASCMCHGMFAHPYSNKIIAEEKTKYGACQLESGGEPRCAVYSKDCEKNEEIWLSPIQLDQLQVDECTCDRVKTGSCAGPFPECAVDEESCDSASDYQNAYETEKQGLQCYLCDPGVFSADPGVVASDGSKSVSVSTDSLSGDGDNTDDKPEGKADDDDDKKVDDAVNASVNASVNSVSKSTYNVIFGIMVGSLTMTTVLAGIIVIRKYYGNDNLMQTERVTEGDVV